MFSNNDLKAAGWRTARWAVLLLVPCLLLASGCANKRLASPVSPRPVMSESVYRQLSRVQAESDPDKAMLLLQEVENKPDLNSYERAMVLEFKGFLHVIQEDYPAALAAYEQSMREPGAQADMQSRACSSATQIAILSLPGPEAVQVLQRLLGYCKNPGADMYKALGYAHYLAKDYVAAIREIERGFSVSRLEPQASDIKWLKALAGSYEKTGDAEKYREVSSRLAALEQASASNESRTSALPIIKVAPVYPRDAVENRIEGYVVLEFTVTRFGTVKDIVVLESEPPGVFDESAIQAAGKFKYKPTVEDGKPVEVSGVKNKIVYKLDDSLK